MAGLFNDVAGFLEGRSATRALADRFGVEAHDVAGAAAVLAVPHLIDALGRCAGDPVGRKEVLRAMRSVDAAGLRDPRATIDGGLFEPTGSALTRLLFGDRRAEVAHLISDHMHINVLSASGMLPVAAWAVLASIADRIGNRPDGRSLVSILERERAELIGVGWGPWMNAMVDTQTMSTLSPTMAQVGAREARRPSVDRPMSPSVQPRSAGTRVSDQRPARFSEPRRPARGRSDQRSPRSRPSARPGSTTPPARGVLWEVLKGVVVVAVFLVLGLAAISWFTAPAGSPEPIDQPIDQSAIDTTVSSETVTGRDGDAGDDSPETVVVDGPGLDERLAFNVMMDDPLERSESTGLAELRFDPDAGEVCYTVDADGIGVPYDGHIHVGPVGVKGGIVVDFGPVDNLTAGCVSVAANDMAAILADPGNHYVEMHDPSGDFTIRVQLSDTAAAITDVGEVTDFDPNGGGATTTISSGRITLGGEVPDQATLDKLIAEVAGLDESRILVVNDLTVVDGAPLPTGRIIVDQSVLFALDSDVLATGDATLLEDLALLFAARSDWTMTVVGHTDSTGAEVYNLELSLRRARAVRDALVSLGVPAVNLKIEGAGSTDPVGDNGTAEGRARNRRIEFNVDR